MAAGSEMAPHNAWSEKPVATTEKSTRPIANDKDIDIVLRRELRGNPFASKKRSGAIKRIIYSSSSRFRFGVKGRKYQMTPRAIWTRGRDTFGI